MRKKLMIAIALAIPLKIWAQTNEKGIHFEQQLSWQQIKAKAKAENRYIFIDCFASWCIPCKAMDIDVYSKDTVGKFMNEHYISIKIQMNKTEGDSPEVKAWYAIAVI